MWGRCCAELNILPTSSEALRLWHDTNCMETFLYFKDAKRRDELEQLARIFGLLWTREELFSSGTVTDDETNKVLVPLSLLLVPDLIAQLRNQLKDVRNKSTTKVELGKLDKEKFLQWYRDFAPNLKT